MFFSNAHILTAILFTPALGALLLLLLPQRRPRVIRRVATGFGLLTVLMALPLVWRFDPSAGARFQFVVDRDWIPSIGARFALGVDGVSLLLVMLTVALAAIAIGFSCSLECQTSLWRCVLLLLIETCLLGVFLSLDFVLFYFFWEAVLVPAYFLISGRGDDRAARAGMKFFLYTLAGSALMLLAIAALWHSRQTFDMRAILAHPFGPEDGWRAQKWLFWGFFLAFAIKAGLFPFHTWLPEAHVEAPAGVSLLLAGSGLCMGLYGFLRVLVPMLPGAAVRYRGVMIVLAIIAIIYGSLLCLAQTDAKRLIAWSSVPQLGFCTLGIFALTPSSTAGSVIQMLSHGVVIAALFILFDIFSRGRGTCAIEDLRGTGRGAPGLNAFFLLFVLAAIGVPVFSGFTGEFAILRGLVDAHMAAAACAVAGVLLLAAALLWFFARVARGPEAMSVESSAHQLSPSEWAILLPLAAFVLWIGLYPQPFFHALEAPARQIAAAANPAYMSRQPSSVAAEHR